MATHPTARPPQRHRWAGQAQIAELLVAPPRLGFGLCARCWQIDVVLEQARPLCRYCDPRLADYLARYAAQLDATRDAGDPGPELPTVDLPEDPTGRRWAA